MEQAHRFWCRRILETYNPSLQPTMGERPHWCYCTPKLLTLRRFREQLGAKAVTTWLSLQLNYAARLWGSADGLTSEQICGAAEAIAATYSELNLAEVMLYLCRLRAGRYGKVAFGALTVDALVSNLPQFMKERRDERCRYERLAEDAARAHELAARAGHCCTREASLPLRALALERTGGDEKAAIELLKTRFWEHEAGGAERKA